jgi:quercetin dioxygenase-like cupin family protein
VHVIRGTSGRPLPSAASIFAGDVATHTYVDETIGDHLRITLVRFSPGGRTKWHTHAFEQAVIVTEGTGIMATEMEEHLVIAGDIVVVPEGERHWHGATEAAPMAHLSIVTPGETIVLEVVSREGGRQSR